MSIAYVFPGQGSQFPGMGLELCKRYPLAKRLFDQADEVLGFPLSESMFHGSDEDLVATRVTQPALFLYAYAAYQCMAELPPAMVAGHSLGEFTALAVSGAVTFEEALQLVLQRAEAMYQCCLQCSSGMQAVLKFDIQKVEEICQDITDEVVVANYNSPQQVVISGTMAGLQLAIERLKAAGARFIIPLKVGGAFHSPLMKPAQQLLADAIRKTSFQQPVCPIYQNVTAQPSQDPDTIRHNLLDQIDHPVLWTQSVRNMIRDGADFFVEVGPGNTLQNLIKRTDTKVITKSIFDFKV